jgi:hypothetical protein
MMHASAPGDPTIIIGEVEYVMMPVVVPSFIDTVRTAERKLSSVLGGTCNVDVRHCLDVELLEIVKTIDDERFREELRYNRDELTARAGRPGFTCFIVTLDGKPIAYDFGYDDEDQAVFYSDSSASLIERKGVGSTLSAVEALYCYRQEYKWIKLSTEERDERGRALRAFWERFGFKVVSVDENDNIVMRMRLTAKTVRDLHNRYLADGDSSKVL